MPDLKKQEILSIMTVKEKIPPIISLKEKPLKQNKPKDKVKDSLLSSKPSAIIIINNDSDSDNNNDTILLPVFTASQPQSLFNKFTKFKHYISIIAITRKKFALLF